METPDSAYKHRANSYQHRAMDEGTAHYGAMPGDAGQLPDYLPSLEDKSPLAAIGRAHTYLDERRPALSRGETRRAVGAGGRGTEEQPDSDARNRDARKGREGKGRGDPAGAVARLRSYGIVQWRTGG